jgi:hypothetical protein
MVLLLLAFAGSLVWLARRDHKALRASRVGLLDDCARLFDRYALTHGDDGFPRLSGRRGARNVDVRLISDTMTIRRLPQLWLQVTVLDRLDVRSGVVVLVRPSGCEFYSLTASFHHVLDTPPSFPSEVIVRGSDPGAEKLLEKLTPSMAAILEDPRVKEIAVTPQGLRLIRQAGEGRRGEYLLLRQAVFDRAGVSAEALDGALDEIETLRAALASSERKVLYA